MIPDTKQGQGIGEILKSFLNMIFHPVSNLDNNPFWNPPKTGKYKFVSKEERRTTLERFQREYPNFRRAYQIHKWIELWNTMHISDEEYRDVFLRHFEGAIKELNEDGWEMG